MGNSWAALPPRPQLHRPHAPIHGSRLGECLQPPRRVASLGLGMLRRCLLISSRVLRGVGRQRTSFATILMSPLSSQGMASQIIYRSSTLRRFQMGTLNLPEETPLRTSLHHLKTRPLCPRTQSLWAKCILPNSRNYLTLPPPRHQFCPSSHCDWRASLAKTSAEKTPSWKARAPHPKKQKTKVENHLFCH